MKTIFLVFLHAVVETYTAMAGDYLLTMATAQAVLQLLSHLGKQIKK